MWSIIQVCYLIPVGKKKNIVDPILYLEQF